MDPHPQIGAYSSRTVDSVLTGTFQVSLTRAVLPYDDPSEHTLPGGRIGDIGLGVVTDGADAARADVVDLGSAEVKVVDLTGPLVVLGWLYPSGLRALRRVIDDTPPEDRDQARAFSFGIAMQVLERAGFSPLTRPTFLRVGFRDLCRDLDLHEGTALRLVLPSGGVARVHLEYESMTLVVRTGRAPRSAELESALSDAFPGWELLRGTLRDGSGTHAYYLPFAAPRSLGESRTLLRRIRRGMVHLLARFEGERYRSIQELTRTFGERDSLRSLSDLPELPRLERIVRARPATPGGSGIH